MVRRKERIQPVIAKPLNDTEKRNLVTSFVTSSVNESVTNNVIKNNSESVINNVTKEDKKIVTNKDTEKVTKSVTKRDTKKVTMIKTISLGKKDIVAKFTSTKCLRPNYNLSEDTIEKIEKVSNILGYKKAEFLDIYLNGTLTKVLKDLEKSNK